VKQAVRVRWERPSARFDGDGWMIVDARHGPLFTHRGSCRDAEQLARILLGHDLVRRRTGSAVQWARRSPSPAPADAAPTGP